MVKTISKYQRRPISVIFFGLPAWMAFFHSMNFLSSKTWNLNWLKYHPQIVTRDNYLSCLICSNCMSVEACWNVDGQMLACSPVKNTDNQSLSVDRETWYFPSVGVGIKTPDRSLWSECLIFPQLTMTRKQRKDLLSGNAKQWSSSHQEAP